MKINIEINEKQVKTLILEHLRNKLGPDIMIAEKDIQIQVKSKQNYKSEWEIAHFKAVFNSFYA